MKHNHLQYNSNIDNNGNNCSSGGFNNIKNTEPNEIQHRYNARNNQKVVQVIV